MLLLVMKSDDTSLYSFINQEIRSVQQSTQHHPNFNIMEPTRIAKKRCLRTTGHHQIGSYLARELSVL